MGLDGTRKHTWTRKHWQAVTGTDNDDGSGHDGS